MYGKVKSKGEMSWTKIQQEGHTYPSATAPHPFCFAFVRTHVKFHIEQRNVHWLEADLWTQETGNERKRKTKNKHTEHFTARSRR